MISLELISANMDISLDMMNKIYSSPFCFFPFVSLHDMSGVALRKLFSGCHKHLVSVKQRFSSLRLQHAALMNNCEANVRWDAISQSPF